MCVRDAVATIHLPQFNLALHIDCFIGVRDAATVVTTVAAACGGEIGSPYCFCASASCIGYGLNGMESRAE